jgi:Ca2+-binding EF-hand superfamily protein
MSAAISGMGAHMAVQAMTGASMPMPPGQKMSNVFSQIDTSNSGSISKSQFSQAFSSLNPPSSFKSMGADAVFSRLDTNNTGSVSKQQFVSGMSQMMSEVRAQKHEAYVQQASATPPVQTTINASSYGLSQLGTHIDVKA